MGVFFFFFSEGIFIKLANKIFVVFISSPSINTREPHLHSHSPSLSPFSYSLFFSLLQDWILKPHVSFIIFPFSNQDLQVSEEFSPLVLPVTKLHEILKWLKPKVKIWIFSLFLPWNTLGFVILWCLWYMLDVFGEYWKIKELWGFG